MRISDYNCKFFGTNETLQKFLADVRKYDVPTAEEEISLVKRYRDGDEAAGQELINRHLRFIYSLAKIYARDENEVVDYVNEGVIGFNIALNKFDLTLENKFITYAVWYVRRQMNFYLNDTRNMITRSNVNKIGKKLDTIKQKYYAENGREPTTEEVKQILLDNYGLDIKEDCDVFEVSISSINEEIDDDYTVENDPEYTKRTSSVNEYEENAEKDYKKALVSTILSFIPEKQADVMKMLYGIDYERCYTTEEVGEKYGITATEVASLRDKIIKYVQQNAQLIKRKAL
jgi:RNA polymerase sigma factor (sigma-70 family)